MKIDLLNRQQTLRKRPANFKVCSVMCSASTTRRRRRGRRKRRWHRRCTPTDAIWRQTGWTALAPRPRRRRFLVTHNWWCHRRRQHRDAAQPSIWLPTMITSCSALLANQHNTERTTSTALPSPVSVASVTASVASRTVSIFFSNCFSLLN